MSKKERRRMEKMTTTDNTNGITPEEKDRLQTARSLKKRNKDHADQATQVQNQAQEDARVAKQAAREAKASVRAEKKAQRAREKATRQANKAAEATKKAETTIK
jgi:hypothetical protein